MICNKLINARWKLSNTALCALEADQYSIVQTRALQHHKKLDIVHIAQIGSF